MITDIASALTVTDRLNATSGEITTDMKSGGRVTGIGITVGIPATKASTKTGSSLPLNSRLFRHSLADNVDVPVAESHGVR